MERLRGSRVPKILINSWFYRLFVGTVSASRTPAAGTGLKPLLSRHGHSLIRDAGTEPAGEKAVTEMKVRTKILGIVAIMGIAAAAIAAMGLYATAEYAAR